MRLPARLVLLADVLSGLAAAAACAAAFALPELVGAFDADSGRLTVQVRGSPVAQVLALCGLALLVVNVLALLYGKRPRPPLRHVVSDAPGGQVKVSREALEAGLRAAGEALEDVTRLRVGVQPGALKKVVVHAHFSCPEGASIHEASGRLRRCLSERFSQMVRLTDGARVEYEIEFGGFSGKVQRKEEVEEPAEEAPRPFTGPQYPIEDDTQEEEALKS